MGFSLMTPWYKSNRKLFRDEKAALTAVAPLLGMVTAGPGFRLNSVHTLKKESVVVHGTYGISIPDSAQQIEYGISILMPNKYPKQLPDMFCNDPKLPVGDIDRHIMDDGSACLGVYADIMTRWSLKPGIGSFLENFVAPFLVWQAYYDTHQKPPSWGERSHFAEGVIEYYAELLGLNKHRSVVEFVRLLARKNRPKGHEICPCGSGDRLRNCHRDLLYNTRKKVSWKYVGKDLQTVFRDDQSKY